MAEKPSDTGEFSIGNGGKFEGSFLSEIVRKAAYILGTICVIMALLGAYLKLNGLPGGGISLILFTTLFSVGAMPLYLYPLYKAESERAMLFAFRLCGFSFAVLQVGLLFYVQRWPGEMNMIYAGAAGQLVFLIVFFSNRRKPAVKTKSISKFAVLAVLVLASLGLGCLSAEKKNSELEDKSGIFNQELVDYVKIKQRVDSLIVAFSADTSNRYLDSAASEYFTDAMYIVTWTEELKGAYVAELNGEYFDKDVPTTYRISKPNDIDLSTSKMVGDDVVHPNGSGIILYGYLAVYRQKKLHPDVSFLIPIGESPDYKDQWVKDNFYHVTAIEMLMRLTVIQKNIYQSVEESIQKKLFVE